MLNLYFVVVKIWNLRSDLRIKVSNEMCTLNGIIYIINSYGFMKNLI